MQSSITTDEQLCEKCCIILDKFPGEDTSIRFDHYDLSAKLQASADRGCRVCQILWMHINVWCTDDHGATRYRISASREFHKSPKSHNLYFRLRIKYECQKANCGYLHRTSVVIRVLSEQRPFQEISHILKLATETLDNDVVTLMQTTTKRWVENCNQNHEKCQQAQLLKKKLYSVPTRLIDVQSYDGKTAILVDTKEEFDVAGSKPPVYLILSYCWGVGNAAAKTTRTNLLERKRQIIVCKLPKTVRNAITVTRAMGVRYLWVDALCIIQPDNDGFLDDWNSEAAQMGRYYANALFCISALVSSDSPDGFLRERPCARYGWREEDLIQYGDNVFSIQSDESISTPDIRAMPLMRRAWALQERVLSTRRLHWTAVGLLWECDSGLFRETEPLRNLLPQYASNIYTHDDLISQIFNLPEAEALGKAWNAILDQYSEMQLTNPADRLAAIHGVAHRLSLQHDAEYFGGIFSAYCSTSLCWREDGPSNLDSAQGFFPSWSWASAGRFMFDLNDPQKIPLQFVRCANPKQFPSLDEVIDFRGRSKRKLWLKGPLVSIRFADDRPLMRDHVLFNLLKAYSDGPIWRGQVIHITMDRDCEDLEISALTLLICYGENGEHLDKKWAGKKAFTGLVVERSEEDGRDAYVRLGHFQAVIPWSEEEEGGKYLDDWITDVNLF